MLRGLCTVFLCAIICLHEHGSFAQFEECIEGYQNCSGSVECAFGADETIALCGPPTCDKDTEVACEIVSYCIPKINVCNGQIDCLYSGSDEIGCNEQCNKDLLKCKLSPMQDKETSAGYVRMPYCYEPKQRCDGSRWPIGPCPSGEDELDCPGKPPTCDEGWKPCPGFNFCAQFFSCDSYAECPLGADEIDCPLQCPLDKFQCIVPNEFETATGIVRRPKCLSLDWLCNGVVECREGSDELNCTNQKVFECTTSISYTNNAGESVLAKQFQLLIGRCDGFIDCDDGSDEMNCTASEIDALHGHGTSRYRCPTPTAHTVANGNTVMVNKRLSSDDFCDHYIDCNDGWDEENCPTVA